MSNDLQAGICSGSWWRTGGFDAAAAASVSASDASTSTEGAGAFTWSATEMVESKTRSSVDDEPFGSASGSTLTFQDIHNRHVSDPHNLGGGLSMDWPQALLSSSSSGTGRAETSFHAMLQEDLSSTPYFRQDPSMRSDHGRGGGVDDSSMNLFKNMNQSFLMEQHQMNAAAANEPGGCSIDNFSLAPAAAALQGMMEPGDIKYDDDDNNRQVDYHQSPMMGYGHHHGDPSESPRSSWPKFTQFLEASPPKPQQASHQLHFSNTTPFWNASPAAGFYPPMQPQFAAQSFEKKPNSSNNLALKPSSEVSRDSSSKKRSESTAFKKPRMETPSPLPSFKVRKEKLGDRITALQQLVSPFGKTDTASVLHEAIDYIKFLHDQVSVLSTPYLKNGNPMHQMQQNAGKSKDREGPKQDLRSRGLCLVPVASTYPMASETPLDFWNPTYGGTYR